MHTTRGKRNANKAKLITAGIDAMHHHVPDRVLSNGNPDHHYSRRKQNHFQRIYYSINGCKWANWNDTG